MADVSSAHPLEFKCPWLQTLKLVMVLFSVGTTVLMADPHRGANCISCHGQSRNGMTLTGFTEQVDLGGGDGRLKLFRVEAGQVAEIGIDVSDTSGDLAISGFSRGGEHGGGNQLMFSPDESWTSRSSSSYYTRGVSSGNPRVSFALTVDPATPTDVYRLEMQIAGDSGGRWGERERFYVEVMPGAPVRKLVAAGSGWKYLDNGSNPPSDWADPGFDDTAWASGFAELGYGDGDEQTELSFGSDAGQKHITTYFRTAFYVARANSVDDLRMRMIYDDGVAVYLNGEEVIRENLVEGAGSNTPADAARGSGEEDVWSSFDIPKAALRNGLNVLATEIHQSSRTSSDISFDLELSATIIPDLLMTANGLTFPTRSGKSYQFERSTDLKVWTPEGPVKVGDGQEIRMVPAQGTPEPVFYRVRIDE